jgi:predicted transcriptional regulator
MNDLKKRHGGHNAGKPSPKSQGRGPVYEIRQALSLTQAQLADKIGCTTRVVQKCEALGILPKSRAVQSNLHALAPVSSEAAKAGEPENSGVFL